MTTRSISLLRSSRLIPAIHAVLMVLVLLLSSFAGFAAELPVLTGRVVDNAGIIDAATKAALTQKLA
ncbi:hypothetical protein O7A60_31780, partial [Mesorhizobium sp. Ld1326N3]